MQNIYGHLLEFAHLFTAVRFLTKTMLVLTVLSMALTMIRRRRQPVELVTSVAIQNHLPGLPALSWISQVLFLAMMLTINFWLAEPVIPVLNETRTMETRDIFIAVDKSGSMDTVITDSNGVGHGRRIDAAVEAVKVFVARRQGDRIGLGVFDDNTYMHWPMTDNLQIIVKKAALIPAYVGGGTNFEGPTGPIQLAVNHWKEYGQAKTKVLIIVSDGEAPIGEERMSELIDQMNALGGKIYLLGVGDTWTDPSKSESKQVEPIKKLVAALNGRVFAVADSGEMLAAVATIDQLEKSTVQVAVSSTFRDVSRYFGLASCLLLILFSASVAFTRELT